MSQPARNRLSRFPNEDARSDTPELFDHGFVIKTVLM